MVTVTAVLHQLTRYVDSRVGGAQNAYTMIHARFLYNKMVFQILKLG